MATSKQIHFRPAKHRHNQVQQVLFSFLQFAVCVFVAPWPPGAASVGAAAGADGVETCVAGSTFEGRVCFHNNLLYWKSFSPFYNSVKPSGQHRSPDSRFVSKYAKILCNSQYSHHTLAASKFQRSNPYTPYKPYLATTHPALSPHRLLFHHPAHLRHLGFLLAWTHATARSEQNLLWRLCLEEGWCARWRRRCLNSRRYRRSGTVCWFLILIGGVMFLRSHRLRTRCLGNYLMFHCCRCSNRLPLKLRNEELCVGFCHRGAGIGCFCNFSWTANPHSLCGSGHHQILPCLELWRLVADSSLMLSLFHCLSRQVSSFSWLASHIYNWDYYHH